MAAFPKPSSKNWKRSNFPLTPDHWNGKSVILNCRNGLKIINAYQQERQMENCVPGYPVRLCCIEQEDWLPEMKNFSANLGLALSEKGQLVQSKITNGLMENHRPKQPFPIETALESFAFGWMNMIMGLHFIIYGRASCLETKRRIFEGLFKALFFLNLNIIHIRTVNCVQCPNRDCSILAISPVFHIVCFFIK